MMVVRVLYIYLLKKDSVGVQRAVVELGRVPGDAEPGDGVVLAGVDQRERGDLQASDHLQRGAEEVPNQGHGDG